MGFLLCPSVSPSHTDSSVSIIPPSRRLSRVFPTHIRVYPKARGLPQPKITSLLCSLPSFPLPVPPLVPQSAPTPASQHDKGHRVQAELLKAVRSLCLFNRPSLVMVGAAVFPAGVVRESARRGHTSGLAAHHLWPGGSPRGACPTLTGLRQWGMSEPRGERARLRRIWLYSKASVG